MKYSDMHIKIAIIAFAVCTAIIDKVNIASLLILILVFMLNMQIRRKIASESLLLVSLIFDFTIVALSLYLLNYPLWMFLLISAQDIIKKSKSLKNGLILVTFIFLIYIIWSSEIHLIVSAVLVFILFIYLLSILNIKEKSIEDLEYLYDSERKTAYELEKAKKHIEEYSKKSDELASAQERDRISQEIHDTVGHKLAALLMQLEATDLLIKKGDDKGKKLLAESIIYLRDTIEVLRKTVRKLKPKQSFDLISSIRELTEDFSIKTGIEVNFEVVGQPYFIMPSISLMLYNSTSESMTNSLRHGKAMNIDIRLTYKCNQIELAVIDNGVGCKSIKKGMGLRSMEERLAIYGGMLYLDCSAGFKVQCIIPYNGGR